MHRLHGRDRRRRPPPRRRPRRRPRRARADAEPAPRRDGRVRAEGQHHPDRRRRTGPTSSTRRCCARAASTGRSSSTGPTGTAASKILEVHSKGKPLAPEIDLDTLAAGTPGFTGADLANLVNEAALLAARRGKKVDRAGGARGRDHARDRRPREEDAPASRRRSARSPRTTSSGHAIVGHYLDQDTDGAQDLDHRPRPGARLHDLAPARGSLPDDRSRA